MRFVSGWWHGPVAGGPDASLICASRSPCISTDPYTLPPPMETTVPLRFGEYSLDTDRRELTRNGCLVPIEPQVFDLLVFLIQNRARVVSKDDLIEGIWG